MLSLVMPILQGAIPAFPYAPQPTALQSFIVIVAIPTAIAAVIALLSGGHALRTAKAQAEARAALTGDERREITSH